MRGIELNYDGRIPPQAVEMEEAVLGAMLLDQSCIDSVMALITPDAFYREKNQIVCEAIFSMRQKSHPVELLTLIEYLKNSGTLESVGGPYALTQLSTKIASSANIDFHARVVLEKYLAREIIRVSSDMQSKAFDSSYQIDDLIAESEKGISSLAGLLSGNEHRNLLDIISQTLDEIRFANIHPELAFGIPTPLTKLNQLTNGWQKSDLIIFAGRPSRGKTAFALSCVKSACEAGKRAIVFSLEMKDTQLMKRMIYSHGIDPDEAGGKISRWNLDIDEKPNIPVSYVSSKCRSIKRKKGLDLVVIDYLQLMKLPTGDNRAYQIGDVTKALKSLAKELDVPVILLSQLSREIEKRATREPELSDLRESGNIEQDADIVIFVSRPHMDGIEFDKENNSTEFLTVLKIAKNRNGAAPVKIKARNDKKVTSYSDWESIEDMEYIGGSQPDKF